MKRKWIMSDALGDALALAVLIGIVCLAALVESWAVRLGLTAAVCIGAALWGVLRRIERKNGICAPHTC